jgi:hypothetical protein
MRASVGVSLGPVRVSQGLGAPRINGRRQKTDGPAETELLATLRETPQFKDRYEKWAYRLVVWPACAAFWFALLCLVVGLLP